MKTVGGISSRKMQREVSEIFKAAAVLPFYVFFWSSIPLDE
jgi:hypothetical protein